MVNIPSIDVPTAIIAVVLSVGVTWVKEEIQKKRNKKLKKRKQTVQWYQEILTLTREIQITTMATFGQLEGYESIYSEDFDTVSGLKESGIDEELLEVILLTIEFSEDDEFERGIRHILQHFRDEQFNEYKNTLVSNFQSELSDYSNQLRKQYAHHPHMTYERYVFESEDELPSDSFANALRDVMIVCTGLIHKDSEEVSGQDYELVMEFTNVLIDETAIRIENLDSNSSLYI